MIPPNLIPLVLFGLVTASVLCAGRRRAALRVDTLDRRFGLGAANPGAGRPGPGWPLRHLSVTSSGVGVRLLLGLVGIAAGARVAGPPGALIAAAGGAWAPSAWERRRRVKRDEAMERQLADLSEAVALAVRSGFAVGQGLEFASAETEEPLRGVVAEMFAEQRLGTPFDAALERFGQSVGTEDAILLVMVLGIHHRTGGNVAVALSEVATAIRERVAVRRELRALTAQGRISGAILGCLPIAFFVVMTATSRHELAPIYRSPAGAAMVVVGLLLNGLAYLWIRSLLKVRL